MAGMLLVGLLMYTMMYQLRPLLHPRRRIRHHPGHSQQPEYPAYLLLLLFAAKLLATSLTLGSGASGGVFSPALFLGATLAELPGAWP